MKRRIIRLHLIKTDRKNKIRVKIIQSKRNEIEQNSNYRLFFIDEIFLNYLFKQTFYIYMLFIDKYLYICFRMLLNYKLNS